MDFIDKTLARRLEAAEELPQVRYVELYQELWPDVKAVSAEICAGHMCYCGADSPIGRAVGLGLERELKQDDLERVEEFYHSRGVPAQIDVTPLHDGAVFELLRQRGYGIAELNNVLWRRLRHDDTYPEQVGGFEIRQGTSNEADSFAEIAARCFDEQGEHSEEFHRMLAPLFRMPGAVSFMATVAGQPAAVGSGLIIPDYKIVALFGAGTLPEFRRRGIQTSLLVERLKLAAEADCEIAVIVTQGGTLSQRNAERLGFRVAYSKATMVKQGG